VRDGTLEPRVREAREQAGLTQQALADRVGLTRQALSAVESGRSVPSTGVALRLARALGSRVEDLFRLAGADAVDAALGGPAEPGTRVALGRVRGRWVAHPTSAGTPLGAADGVLTAASGGAGIAEPIDSKEEHADNLLIAGCAPALASLAQRLGEQRCGVRVRWVHAASERALGLLERGLVHVGGAHLLDPQSHEFNGPFARRLFPGRRTLVATLARWRQGLVVAPGNPLGLRTASDLMRPDLRLALREQGAGARALLDRLLSASGGSGSPGLTGPQVRGHMEVATAVALGAADAGIAIEGAALAYGLGFVPLAEERFDLVVAPDLVDDPRIDRLLGALDSRPFRSELRSLGGYEVTETGHVRVEDGA
jgi:molybdate-binding protein/DNA-binding XRE family transcriptional regulator